MYLDKFERLAGADKRNGYLEVLKEVVSVSRQNGKLSFIGEFGLSRDQVAAEADGAFNRIVDSIVESGVHLAAMWVYEFKAQESSWSVAVGNDRSWMLRKLVSANRNMR